tara:strand:- start:3323 stop:3760 length:438 start_codon:yes stop_codon:yes gene_type:complete
MSKLNIIIIIISFVGCNVKKDTMYSLLENFILKEYNVDNLNDYDNVVVVTDEGSCIECNRAFSKLMGSVVNRPDILFIISTSGSKIDISYYLEFTTENVIVDRESKFSDLGLVKSSAIIYLEKSKIVDIIEVNLDNLAEIAELEF